MIRLGNNEVLKTLTKTLTFVDANANAYAGGSTIALPERCSGKLKMAAPCNYSKCPEISNTKVSDKMPYANCANPDQTALEGAV